MSITKFIYSPGGENERGTGDTGDNSKAKKVEPETSDTKEDTGEEKPIIEKIKEALQDWSNKDEADQEFDDTRV